MKIIATHPILYLSKQYKVGDELPANDHEMVEAWLKAKTAKKEETAKEETPKESKPKKEVEKK
jgi:hypothetical protein